MKRKIAEIVKDVNETYKRIGVERSKLRELADEIDSILDDLDDTQSIVAETIANLEELNTCLDDVSKYL